MTAPEIPLATVMTPEEARECLDRYNTSHWNKSGQRAKYSIPASPMDDDIRMSAFIDQAESDRARIRQLEAEVAKLEGIITGSNTEYRVTLGVNLQRHWPVDAQNMLGRMLFGEDVPALRAAAQERDRQIAAQAEEIRKLKADQSDWRKGVGLIASSLGDKNQFSCSHLAMKALTIRAENESLRASLKPESKE